MPIKEYLKKVDTFNALLKEATEDDVHLHYVMLRGFQFTADNTARRLLLDWSDGVNPTNDGLWKYANELKNALMQSIHIMLRHACDLRCYYNRR